MKNNASPFSRRILSWLLTASMTASLLPGALLTPVLAASTWGVTYDAASVDAGNLTVSIYDVEDGLAQRLAWTDEGGTLRADQSAADLFGDGHSHYALVQYLDGSAVVREYRRYMIQTMGLETQWQALPESGEEGQESKAAYGTYEAYVDVKLADIMANSTPDTMRQQLDSMVSMGYYSPAEDYAPCVKVRSVALSGSDPGLHIDGDFFAQCVKLSWTLPEADSGGVGGFPGAGGDFGSMPVAGSSSLRLLLSAGGTYIPALRQTALDMGDLGEEESDTGAGEAYLNEKLGLSNVETGDELVNGRVDTAYALWAAPGDYALVLEDSTSGEAILDWEMISLTAQGGSVDFSTGRSYGSVMASWTGYLPEATSSSLEVSFTGATVPGALTLSLGEGTAKCKTGVYDITALTTTESWMDLSSVDMTSGDVNMDAIGMQIITTGLQMERELSVTSGVALVDLGNLAAAAWQGTLDVVSAETGEAKAAYAPGEELEATMALQSSSGLSMEFAYAMEGTYGAFMDFMTAPSDGAYEALFTLPAVTLRYAGASDPIAQGTGLLPLGFAAPESSRVVEGVYQWGEAINATASATVAISGGVETDTQPPAAPTGFAGHLTGDSIAFSWNPNGEEDLAGYRLYRCDATGAGQESVLSMLEGSAVSAQAAINSAWGPGPWYFALAALDETGNESANSALVTIQDPNVSFYGEGAVSVTVGTLNNGVLTTTEEDAAELTLTFMADPALPAQTLPETVEAAISYQTITGQAAAAAVTLTVSGHTYTAAWAIPKEAAILRTVTFAREETTLKVIEIPYDIAGQVRVTLPDAKDYPLSEYFGAMVIYASGASKEVPGENGVYKTTLPRRSFAGAGVYFQVEGVAYRTVALEGSVLAQGGEAALTASQMPDYALVIPTWTPREASLSPAVEWLDGSGDAVGTTYGSGNGTPILVGGSAEGQMRLVLSAVADELHATGSDPIFTGVPFEKGAVYAAQGTLAYKEADRLLTMPLYWGENGDIPCSEPETLRFSGERSYTATWHPYLNQADVSHIPAGTYTLSCGSVKREITLTDAPETTLEPLRSYDTIDLRMEVKFPLSTRQPDAILEELGSSGNLQQNWVTPQRGTLTVQYFDKTGAPHTAQAKVYSSSATGETILTIDALERRSIDLATISIDFGTDMELYTFDGMVGSTPSYKPYRSAAVEQLTVSLADFSRTEKKSGLFGVPGNVTLSGSESVTLKAVPTVTVNSTRRVEEAKAYFLFAHQDGTTTVESRDFAYSQGGGTQRFQFDTLPQGTYDVLFYLTRTGRQEQLEQGFLLGSGDFAPPPEAEAVGLRGVTFSDSESVLYLDTPAAPVNTAFPGVQGVTLTPSNPTPVEGDLLSFTMGFTYVPEEEPLVLTFEGSNFAENSEALAASIQNEAGEAVRCTISGNTITIPNDCGTLKGTVVFSATVERGYMTGSSASVVVSQERSNGSILPRWQNRVQIVSFYSNLPAKAQGAFVPIKGRAPAGTMTAEVVSLRDGASTATITIPTSAYGYWSAELPLPYSVENGIEEFQVTFRAQDSSELKTQTISATAGPTVLPTLIRYIYDYAENTKVTLVGRRSDNYQALREGIATFYTSYGTGNITVEAVFDDTAENASGCTDAQIVGNVCLLVSGASGLYYFDLTPQDKKEYTTPQGKVPYATTYAATYRNIYYGPFELCYNVLDPNGVAVPAVVNPALPEEPTTKSQLTAQWADLSQLIYENGGILTGESTFVSVAEDAYMEDTLTADVFAKEGLSPGQKEELKSIEMFPSTPTDLTYSVTHTTSFTTVADIDAAIRELDGLENEEYAALRYEDEGDGVVAYIRYFDPVYAYVLSDQQPDDPNLVSLDLALVQKYVYLYDLSDVTEGSAVSYAAPPETAPAVAAFALTGGDGSPTDTAGLVAAGTGAMDAASYGTAIAKGAALGLMESGEVVSKGIDTVKTTVESLAMLDMRPEAVAVAKDLEEHMFGSKGAKVLKGVGIVKSTYEAGKKIVEGDKENQAKKDALAKIHAELAAQKDAAIRRCTCLLDENGERAQREIYRLYREGLDRIDTLIEGIEFHENTDITVDLMQSVAPMPKKLDFNVYKLVADITIDASQEIAWSMHDSYRWQEVRDVYQECYNGMSRASFQCDLDLCKQEQPEPQEPKVVDNLQRAESRYVGPIPASPVGRIPIEHIIDPSGVVYEGYLANPLSGVTCTIQYLEGGTWKDWTAAPGYNDQRTTITTNESGFYRWDVPQGSWRVKYEKAGYNNNQPVYSVEMPVPPVWLDVNQNMLAAAAAPEAAADSENGVITVSFTKPIQWNSQAEGGIAVTIGGQAVEGTWSVLQGGVGDIYESGISYAGSASTPSETPTQGQLASVLCFTPTAMPVSGAGFDVTFTPSEIRSYSGQALAGASAVQGTIQGGSSGGSGGGVGSGGGSAAVTEKRETITISPKGGTYKAFGGQVQLTAGKGIVSAETKVELSRSEGTDLSPAYGLTMTVQPTDTVELTVKLHPAARQVENPLKLGLWVQEEGQSQWRFAGGAYDEAANTLTILTRVNGVYEARYGEETFSDLSQSHWAYDYLDILASRWILQGSGGKAKPNAPVNRAELVTFMVRVLQANSLIGRTPAVSDNFTDVPQSAWYYFNVNLAAKRGLVNGYGEGIFKPLGGITREELAAVLARAVLTEEEIENAGEPDFRDGETIAPWARAYVAALQEAGFFSGDDQGNFRPKSGATRAEVGKLMYKAMEHFGLLTWDEDAPELPCLTCPYSR